MFQQMLKVRNTANAYYLLNTATDDGEFEYVERFKLNWDLYKGKMPSDVAKGKFLL